MNELILKKFAQLEKRFLEIEKELTQPETISDKTKYQILSRELSKLSPIINSFREHRRISEELEKLQAVLKSAEGEEIKSLVEEELRELREKKITLEESLETFFLEGEDPHTGRDIIVEIRAGTGGQESSLFVAELYRMYAKFANRSGLKIEHIDSHPTELGGFKEIIFSVQGREAYSLFKFESGVHRVQRVPVTEAGGRIHTSAVSVVVMPEPEDVEVEIDPKDLRIDVYRSSGPGGQSVNTTDSAVRITHLPTNMVVTCQDERSQIKNRAKAMRVLKARLLDLKLREQKNRIDQTRKSFIGTGDRSEKIRTYNFPQRRVTDHRINFTLYKLEDVLEGDLTELVKALQKAEREEKLKHKLATLAPVEGIEEVG
ncbi:MAG: peptide chain release factor 1 [Candidatus Omnitrophica bacterium]|nr:peptide chain release factor 1 [Candidatus Omnitrophota bacterium]